MSEMHYCTKAELRDAAKAAAKEAVQETLQALGIDTDDIHEAQKDFMWVRKSRDLSERVSVRVVLTAVTLAITGVVAAVGIAVKLKTGA